MDGSHDSGLVADEANSHDMLERLRRAEERLRVAMDEDHLGVWRCDFSPGQIAFSPGVGQHLGLPTDTRLTLETYYGYVYPEDRERVRQAVEQSIRKGEDHDAEYRTLRRQDGRVRWVRAIARCCHDQNGKPDHLDGIIYDITRKKRQEERLHRADERLRRVMDAAQLGIWYCDRPFDKFVLSTGISQHTGLPSTEVARETFLSSVHHDDRERVRRAIERCVEDGEDYDVEYRTARLDEAKPRWLRGIGRCSLNADGRPHRFDGIIFDITDKKRKEEERERLLKDLYGAEHRLQVVMDAANIGVWYCDRPFDKLVFSPGTTQLLGLRLDTILTLDMFYSLVHEDDREWVRRAFQRCIRDGEDFDLECRTVRYSDGRLRWVRTIGRCFHDRSGKLDRVDGIFLDVMQKKREEKERERLVQKLSEATQLRERLLGIVSHDLKTPLTAITLGVKIVRSTVQDESTTKQLDRILNSTERMNRLINELLDFARIRARGEISIELEAVDLHALCRQTIDELAVAHPGRLVSLQASGDGRIVGDGDRLAQVLTNLLGNAIQHGGGGAISVGVSDEGTRVAVSVHNQGPPIPPDLLPFIFDPFHQGGRYEKTSARSVGLGLYIAQQIVLAHSGQIQAVSPDGDGTTFIVRLPRHPSDRLSHEASTRRPEPSRPTNGTTVH